MRFCKLQNDTTLPSQVTVSLIQARSAVFIVQYRKVDQGTKRQDEMENPGRTCEVYLKCMLLVVLAANLDDR